MFRLAGVTELAPLPRRSPSCAMFARTAVSISTHHRASPAHLLAGVIATLGLILVIFAPSSTRTSPLAKARRS